MNYYLGVDVGTSSVIIIDGQRGKDSRNFSDWV